MKVSLCSLFLLASLISAEASAQFARFDRFGTANGYGYGGDVTFLGDLNGDGFAEWAASAPGAPLSGMPWVGAVQVFSGRNGQILREHRGELANAVFGIKIVDHGDIDGDGVSDYAIGAPAHTETVDRQGKVTVYSGADGSEIRSFLGGFATSRFGQVMDAGGDLDGDGVRDLLVSAFWASPNQHGAGRVNVFSGATGARLFVVDGQSNSELRGYSACIIEDVDGDGLDDVVTGAPQATVPSLRVHSGATTALLRTIWPQPNVDHRLGGYLEGVGDVDGDGAGDFLVATKEARIIPGPGAIDYRVGRVSVHSGATGAVLTEVYGRGEHDDFGQSACTVADYDGDGVRDFAAIGGYMYITTPGPFAVRLVIHSSATGELLVEQPLLAETWQNGGTSLAAGPDVTGDGVPDLLFGNDLWPNRHHERGRVMLLSGAAAVGKEAVCGSSDWNSATILFAQGSDVAANNDLTLHAAPVPANTFGYFLSSRSTQAGPNFGGFLPLCLGGNSSIGRYAAQVLQSSEDQTMQLVVNVHAIPSGLGALSASTGETHYFQLWYRRGNGSDFSTPVGVTFR